jgi:hypothetical protein
VVKVVPAVVGFELRDDEVSLRVVHHPWSSSLLGVELTRRRRPVDMLAVRLMSTGLVVTLFSLVGTIVVGIAIWRFFPR